MDAEQRARELLAAELDAIRFPAMAAELRDPDGYNTLGAAMVRVVARALTQAQPGWRVVSVELLDFAERIEQAEPWLHKGAKFTRWAKEIAADMRERAANLAAAPAPQQGEGE